VAKVLPKKSCGWLIFSEIWAGWALKNNVFFVMFYGRFIYRIAISLVALGFFDELLSESKVKST
jgi:hypothetical protein